MPHVVFGCYVFFKCHMLIVKRFSFKTWKRNKFWNLRIIQSKNIILSMKKWKNSLILTYLTAYKARIFQNIFFLLFFRSQICKRVNDDTKDKVENNNDDDEEKQHVIDNSWEEKGFVHGRRSQYISNSSTVSQALVHCGDQA